MNDNAPDAERWLPMADPAKGVGKTDALDPDLDRARREAEAVIAKAFDRKP